MECDSILDHIEEGFHGFIDRSEAERRLFSDSDPEEGLFLVRDSVSSPGDFVLSVIVNRQSGNPEVIHYQIRRHGKEDSLFSLAEQTSVVIHGLDELIRYYVIRKDSGLQHKLIRVLNGGSCLPGEALLHGSENLLHRAVLNDEIRIVSELLKSGYRNLSSKNEEGRTAVHLASINGFSNILSLLISYGASVNVADSSGYSPLHFACQMDQTTTLILLLSDGKADPTFRNQNTGWIPLHEASWSGNIQCCRILLEYHSPILPRTPKNETPSDLARANNHIKLAQFIESFIPHKPSSILYQYYHPDIVREKAIEKLHDCNSSKDGTFLIRNSHRRTNTFVLSLCFDKKYHHFEIVKQGIYYFLSEGPYFTSIEHLVDHYNRFQDGLPIKLLYPVSSSVHTKESRKNSYASLPRLVHKREDIPRESLRVNKRIGEGEFGHVYDGIYKAEDGTNHAVAMKVLNDLGESQSKDFMREVEVMLKLDHPCVVKLIGVSCGPPIQMILELVPLGSLSEYLKDFKEAISFFLEIPLWASQIANGMMYLESQRFVHRDLAARNILLATKFQAKISDFGLSRSVNQDKDYYRASEGGKWPIKWYAPECVNYGTFSHLSDVWSFGVLLWEMYTFGQCPYSNMNGAQTLEFLEAGNRLSRPEGLSDDIFSLINKCWNYSSSDRPTFKELFIYFSESSEYVNIRELRLSHEKECNGTKHDISIN